MRGKAWRFSGKSGDQETHMLQTNYQNQTTKIKNFEEKSKIKPRSSHDYSCTWRDRLQACNFARKFSCVKLAGKENRKFPYSKAAAKALQFDQQVATPTYFDPCLISLKKRGDNVYFSLIE